MKIRNTTIKFIEAVKSLYGEDHAIITMAELKTIKEKKGYDAPIALKRDFHVKGRRGLYNFSEWVKSYGDISSKMIKEEESKSVNVVVDKPINKIENKSTFDINMYIPEVNKKYVASGENWDVINNLVKSNMFFPCYIWGQAGIGKTSSIEQACAINKRGFFRVQITSETVDEDLIGSMKLIDGNTVWQDGPVISAYRTGSVCVLDEVDLNSNLMILQGILEKKPFYIKQTGELVHPAEGFQVFATGNTKGDGNGVRFIGTTILNDAFLDRFAIVLEQPFPSIAKEKKIAKLLMKDENINMDSNVFDKFFEFIKVSRDSYQKEIASGSEDAVYISTRRIAFIIKSYKLTGDMKKALNYALSRYSEEEKKALLMAYNAIDNSAMVNSYEDEED